MSKRKAEEHKENEKERKPRVSMNKFQELYATAVFRMCWLWTYDDCSDTVDNWPPKGVFTNNVWQMILQPKSNGYQSSIIFKRVDQGQITKKVLTTVEESVQTVHEWMMESFEEVLSKTDGKWFFPMTSDKRGDAHAVLQIVKPLTLSDDSKYLSMTFEYLGVNESEMQSYWFPSKLATILNLTKEFDSFEKKTMRLPYQHRIRADEQSALEWMSAENLSEFCRHKVE